MGKSLFSIEEEYFQILNEIEELDGEITPEIEEKLTIHKEELEDKLRSYKYILEKSKYDKEYIKAERERLANRIKSNDNIKTKLVERIVEALNIFGDKGKSGNYTLKFPDFTVYTKNTPSVKYTEWKLEEIINSINEDREVQHIDGIEGKYSPKKIEVLNNFVNGDIFISIPIKFALQLQALIERFLIDNDIEEPAKITFNVNKTKAKDFLNLIEENENLLDKQAQNNNVNSELYGTQIMYKQVVKDIDLEKSISTTAIFK